jgi:uncharacterized integral membrane protein
MVSLIIIIIILVLSIVVAVQNADPIVFNVLVWEFEWPLSLFLLLFFAVGLVFGLVAVVPQLLKKGKHVRTEKKKVKTLEKEVLEKGQQLEVEYIKNKESNINNEEQ